MNKKRNLKCLASKVQQTRRVCANGLNVLSAQVLCFHGDGFDPVGAALARLVAARRVSVIFPGADMEHFIFVISLSPPLIYAPVANC